MPWTARSAAIAAQLRHLAPDTSRGSAVREPLGDEAFAVSSPHVDLVALDEALEKLGTFDERKVRVIEARFFVGLTVEETASLLGVSPSTVKREWEFARTWLMREMCDALE